MGTQDKRFNSIWSLSQLENLRINLQQRYDYSKNIEDRRKLGQFSTPFALANDIITFGLKYIDHNNNIRFFDPAFGTGAFYSALLSNIQLSDIKFSTAIEIDPLLFKIAQDICAFSGIKIINADFTELYHDNLYNFIICNPPYVRHHLINSLQKKKIKDKTKELTGVTLSGLAGLYCHFLLQSISWMDKDAIGGWLIPSEFMDVNYGHPIKSFLLSKVDLFRIHRFKPKNIQFDDALVSSAVIWFKKRTKQSQAVTFSFGGTLMSPQEIKEISYSSLLNEPKWTRFPCAPQRTVHKYMPKLRDYFNVKRGIATGGNNFFILNHAQILVCHLNFFVRFFPVQDI